MQQSIGRTAPPPTPRPAGRAHWWSSSRGRAVSLAATTLGLELLPVEALLIALAAGDGVTISEVALPFWYGILIVVAARLLGGRLRHAGTALVVTLTTPLVIVTWLVLLRISPAAYGTPGRSPFDVQWLVSLVTDTLSGASTAGHALLLLVLVVYLWFRGVRLGGLPIILDDILRRLTIGMAVLVIASAVLVLAPTSVRAPAIGAFTFLLPAEVFCGLVASALARLAEQSLSGAEADRQLPWVSSSIGLAGAVVLFALLLGVIFNGGNVHALLAHLGPVGALLNALGEWITNAFGQLLNLVFGVPVRAFKSVGAHLTTAPSTTSSTCTGSSCQAPDNPPPPLFIILFGLIIFGFFLLIIVLLIVRLYRLIRDWFARQAHLAPLDEAEEREALDGGSLLRKQLRDLFRRRRPVRAQRSEDSLDPRSIRGLYREVLRAAARAGLPRLSTETPDEFATRAPSMPPLALGTAESTSDLVALSESYDAVRYGDAGESATTRATAGARANRLITRLRSRGR